MGLKTTNYYVKRIGMTIHNAYAIIKNIHIRGEYARADFVIYANRLTTFDNEPLETVKVEFALNRNESPFITAYKTAKGQHYENRFNEETEKVETIIVNNSIFYGWDDDIIE